MSTAAARGGAHTGRTPDIAAPRTASGPGRPRDPQHDERIIDAVIGLIDAGERISVNAVVAASGVSRAALYRRWPSIADLIAAALDRGRAPILPDTSGTIRETFLALLFDDPEATRGRGYSDRRFRMRLMLVLESPELQRAYWDSHVRRRRSGMVAALRSGMERGELRPDLDPEACIDLINGVFYYQVVVRGADLGEAATLARCRAAFDTAWRGMAAEPED
ncbi:TetR/AcrR family transcriptional regulator [Brevibacterium album]|uniref:TetR/AcrR family transcriptional regulator n=1 Tax=Brevibacterium album TaxID=417948 RepID=UPI000403F889|nr:TetR/AcrR family transcriptional regulator [Brevibacterium album]